MKMIKEVDKFDNKTTMKLNESYKLSRDFGILSAGVELSIRYLSMPDVDSIFIDLYYFASEDVHDFLYLDGGNMILRINDCENITLPFIATGDRSVSSFEDSQGIEHVSRTEYNFVEIDKTTLEKICNATSVEIKLGGRNPKIFNASKCQRFISYCKSFYNGLYNLEENTLEGNTLDTKLDTKPESVLITIGAVLLIAAFLFWFCRRLIGV